MYKRMRILSAAIPLTLGAGSACASVTFNITAGILDIPDNSLLAFVVDDGDGDFGDLTDPTTFTPDEGDQLIALFSMNSNLGLSGGLSQSQGWAGNVPFTGNNVALIFYDTPFDAGATGPGIGVSGGIITGITANQFGIGGQDWVVPSDGATVALNFLTDSLGNAFLGGPTGVADSQGQPSFVTGVTISELIWSGGSSNNWNDAGNYVDAAAPIDGDEINFTGDGNAPTNNDYDPASFSFSNIIFNATSGANTITGNDLVIGADGAIRNQATGNTQTFQIGIHSSSPMTFDAQAGDLVFDNPITLNGADGLLTVTGAADTTINAAIGATGGEGAVTKSGTGSLTLAADNTYTGETTINEGTVVAAAADAIPGAVRMAGGTLRLQGTDETIGDLSGTAGTIDTNGQTLTVNQNTSNQDFAGQITGAGSLVKAGAQALTLSADNSYTGGTTIQGGTLVANSADAIPGAVTITSGTLLLQGSDESIGDLSGAAGTIDTNGQSLTVIQTTAQEFAGQITGSGALVKAGNEMLTLSGNNDFGGGTTIVSGKLALAGSLGSGVTVLDGATLAGTGAVGDGVGDDTLTVQTGGIVAPGNSVGTLNLNGDASFASGSILAIEIDTTLTTSADLLDVAGSATLADGFTITLDQLDANRIGQGETFDVLRVTDTLSTVLDNLNVASNISGVRFNPATVDVSGNTILRLIAELSLVWDGDADNDGGDGDSLSDPRNYLGNVGPAVSGSNLDFAGSAFSFAQDDDGVATVDSPAINLGGLEFQSGLGVGGLTLDGSRLDFSDTAEIVNRDTNVMTINNDIVAGTGNLIIDAAAGDLTLSGTIDLDANAADLAVEGTGNTTLGGVITGDGDRTISKSGTGELDITADSSGTFSGKLDVNDGTVNLSGQLGGDAQVDGGNLDVTGSLAGSVTVNAGHLGLGGAVGDDINLNDGTLDLRSGQSIGGDLNIAGGTISNDDTPANVAAHTVFTGDVSMTGDQAVTFSGGATLEVGEHTIDTSNTAGVTFSAGIGGAGSLVKAGSEALALAADNTYAGDTTIQAGTLNANSDDAIPGAVSLTGGTLRLDGFDETVNGLSGSGGTIDTNGQVLTVNQSGIASTFDGRITGSGSITKTGDETLALGGPNDFTGGVNINGGALTVSADNNLGDAGGPLGFDGGELRYDSAFDSNRNVAVHSGGGTINTNGNDVAQAGAITGPGTLIKTGDGKLTLSNSGSNFTGGLTLAAGTLSVGADGALGSGPLTIQSGTIEATDGNRDISNALVVDADFQIGRDSGTGGGSITFSGAAAINESITLTQTNTQGAHFTAAVTLDDTTLTIEGTQDLEFSGELADTSGAGALIKNGTGSLTLSAANNYGGGTTLNTGTLEIGNDRALGTGDLTVNGGAIQADGGAVTIANTVNVNSDFEITGTNDLTIAGDDTIHFGDLSGATRTATISNTGTTTWSATLSASTGVIAKAGQGTLIVSGDNSNSLSADVRIDAGTLTVQNSNALDDNGAVTLAQGATFKVDDAETIDSLNTSANSTVILDQSLSIGHTNGDSNIAGVMQGLGGLIKRGSGAATLAGTNTYTGQTTVDAGLLAVTGSTDSDTLVNASGTLDINSSSGDAIDDGAAINLAQGGARANLLNDETIGVLTVVEGATFNLNDNALTVSGSSSSTVAGDLAGQGGSLIIALDTQTNPDAALTLSGTNTYTGDTRVTSGRLELAGGAAIPDDAGVQVDNGGTLALMDSEQLGALAGDGNVELSNATTLTLTGTQDTSFSGTITDLGGSAGVTLDLPDGVVADFTGATFDFDGGLDISHGDFIGPDTIAGGLNVGAGSSYIHTGTITGDVDNTGFLGGTGVVMGRLVNRSGGIVAPGGSIGTMTIVGNDFVNEGGSTLEIELNGSADDATVQNDRVDVENGDAIFEAGSSIVLLPDSDDGDGDGNIAPGDRFEIVRITQGAGSIMLDASVAVGPAPEVANALAFNFEIADDFISGQSQILAVIAVLAQIDISDLQNNGASPDQLAAAELLNDVRDSGSGQNLFDAVQALQNQSQAALFRGLDEIGPLAFEPSLSISVENARLFNGAVGNYFSARRAGSPRATSWGPINPDQGPMLAGSLDPALLASVIDATQHGSVDAAQPWSNGGGWGGFARGVGIFQDRDDDGGHLGYNADSAGGLVGLDRQIGEDLILGLSVGYLYTDVDLARGMGDHEIDTIRVGPYLSYSPRPWFVDAALTYGYHNFESERRTPLVGAGSFESEHDGHDLAFFVATGFDIEMGNFTISPTGSLHYLFLYEEDFIESGAPGSGALSVDSRSSDSLRSRFGVSLRYLLETEAMTLVPEGSIGWKHEMLASKDEIDATLIGGGGLQAFQIDSGKDDSLFLTAGLTALFTQRVSAFLRYDGDYDSEGEVHGVTGGLHLRF